MFTALVEWPTIIAHTAVCSGTYIYLFQATELSRFYVWVGCTIHVTNTGAKSEQWRWQVSVFGPSDEMIGCRKDS